MFKSKKVQPLCKNCRLFDEKRGLCQVVVLHEGKRIHLPVFRNDTCFFENEFSAINEQGVTEKFKVGVEQVKFWVEDSKTGEKTNGDGVVKMEYPETFFGTDKSK